MKVGVFVGGWAPEVGGGFTIVSEIVRALGERPARGRHTFTLLTTAEGAGRPPAQGALEVLPIGDVFNDVPLATRLRGKAVRGAGRLAGFSPHPTGEVPVRPAVDALLTREKIDVVWHLSSWECCTLEIPFITVVWDLQHRRQPYFPELSDDGKWAYRERWLSTVLRRAAMVVVGTEVGRDEVERFYDVPRERIRLMPHPTPRLAEGSESLPRLVEGEYLFYPAQFWPHKNHVNLLQALAILRRRHGIDLSLVLTGSDRGNLPFVREVARDLGLADQVKFLGFVSTAELASLYRHAFALTYVTYFGPENLPPLEAFAAGCPVVASDVAGAREQMGDAALLVEPRDPEQIAAAVVRLRSEPGLRERLIHAGAARAKRFTPADYVEAVETWLDEFEGIRRCWPSGVYGAAKGQFP